MPERKLAYPGKDSAEAEALVEGIANKINYLLTETAALEGLEKCLSKFISTSLSELTFIDRGHVWLGRDNARQSGKKQDVFYIHFCPSEQEKTKRICRYIQAVLAEGSFLKKELIFNRETSFPSYVMKEFVPFLQQLFERMDFTVSGLPQ